MKEKILQMIKEKLGQTSLSERTITQKAERLSKKYSKEEDITKEVIDDAVEDLKDMAGQYNHDIAAKTKEIEDKYKEGQNANSGNGSGNSGGSGDGNNSGGQGGGQNEMPGWFVKYQEEQNEKLRKIQDNLNSERESNRLNSFKDDLRKAMKEKGADKPYFIDTVLGRIQKMEENSTVEGVVEKMLAEYDKDVTAALGDGAAPRSVSGDGRQTGNAGIDSFFAKKAEEMGISGGEK